MKKKDKVHKVLSEFKAGTLKSGAGKHPKVKSRKQAIAIALSEARRGEAIMADYELDEAAGEKIQLEDENYFILLEQSAGPEGWIPVNERPAVWTPVPRVTIA